MWPFDQNNQQAYQQYAQGYDTGNYNSFNPNQALGHLRQFIQGAPPEMQQQIFQQHFEQMPYEHRALLAQQMPPEYGADPNDTWSMSQNFMRMGREQPQLLQRIFSHPVLLGGALALTGLVAKHMLSHREAQNRGQQYDYNQGFQNQGYPNQGYQNQGGYPNQGYQNQGGYQDQGYPNQGYQGQGGYQDQELRRELNEERREEKELRRELREEEREGHHRHRDDF